MISDTIITRLIDRILVDSVYRYCLFKEKS